jgi:hypothetical protein
VTTPWPGDQMPLYDAFVKAGGKDPYDDLYYQLDVTESPDTTTTLVAGDDFYVYSDYARTAYSDDPIGECNWLVDIVSGSAQVEVFLSRDPDYSYDEPTWPAAVTRTWEAGRQIYPLPSGDRIFDWIWGNAGALALRVRVVSGTVEVGKLWLQAEPPDGLKAITGWEPGEILTPPLLTRAPVVNYTSLYYFGQVTWSGSGSPIGVDNTSHLQEAFAAKVYNPGASTVNGIASGISFQAGAGFSLTAEQQGGGVPPVYNMMAQTNHHTLSMVAKWASFPDYKPTPVLGTRGRDYVYIDGAGFDWEPGTTDTVGWDDNNAYIVASNAYGESVGPGHPYGESGQDAFASLTGNVAGLASRMEGPASPIFPTLSSLYNEAHPVSSLPHSDITLTAGLSWGSVGPPGLSAMWAVGSDTSTRGGGDVTWYWCYSNDGQNFTPSTPGLRVQRPNYRLRVPTFELSPDRVLPTGSDLLPSTSVADTGEYSYMGDVGVGGVPPVLWFVYQKWGFLGQHFVAYGHGLGDTQPELNGRLYFGVGPPSTYPVAGEFRPPLAEWALYPAGPNAYDGSQVQFPGTSVAAPKVDTEHQIVEFVVPVDLPLLEPTEYHLYVVNDHGTSNALSLLLYPMIDVDMEAAEPLLLTVTGAMGVFDTPETFEGPALFDASPLLSVLPQNYSRISAPWVLTSRVPERAPTYLTQAKAAFSLTGGAPATGLDDPVTVALSVPLRYRPLDSKVASRPDLGTGMSAWNSNESSSMDWKWNYLYAPYVDAENVVSSRNGSIVRPAMAFDGKAWAETTASFPTGPKMVFAMAVTIFPDPQARSFLLSSFVSGAVDPDSFPIQIYVEGDQLSLVVGTKIQTTKIAPGYIGRRPVIIAFTINDSELTYVVASDKATMRTMTHPKMTAGGLRLYLGRNNNAAQMQLATMDVLDLGIDHTAAATVTRLWSIVNRLDGIYGVMK